MRAGLAHRDRLFLAGLVLLALFAAIVMWLSTRQGAGLDYDSMYYMSAARTLLEGRGLGRVTALGGYEPMTHYPPFYPMVLAGLSLTGFDMIQVARLVCLLTFAVLVFLTGLVAWRASGSRLAGLGASLVALLSTGLIEVSAWALSEPLFLCLMLAVILVLDRYMMTNRRAWLLAAAGLAALACLTRYVGVALVITAVLTLLMTWSVTLRHRLEDVAILCTVAFGPLALWMLRNVRLSGTLANRRFDFTPVAPEKLDNFAATLVGWFLPDKLAAGIPTYAAIAILLIVLLAVFVLAYRPGEQPGPVEQMAALHTLVYPLLIILSLLTYDPTTPLNDRILMPVYVGVLVLLASAMSRIWKNGRAWQRALAVGLILPFLLAGTIQSSATVSRLGSQGLGYAGVRWESSVTAQTMKDVPTSLIYTNNIAAIYFVSGKLSVGIPSADAAPTELDQMRQNLSRPDAYLVIFRPLTGEFAPLEKLSAGMEQFGFYDDGEVYHFENAAP